MFWIFSVEYSTWAGLIAKNSLEMAFMILNKQFYENHMVLNPGKCHYIVISDNDPSHKIVLNNNDLASFNKEKLLGRTLILILHLFVKKRANQIRFRSEYLAIKFSSKIPIKLLPTDVDVYLSIFKKDIK